jgi:hypothetical protein
VMHVSNTLKPKNDRFWPFADGRFRPYISSQSHVKSFWPTARHWGEKPWARQ